MITPALSYEYITHNAMDSQSDVTLVAITSALRINVGYTAMGEPRRPRPFHPPLNETRSQVRGSLSVG